MSVPIDKYCKDPSAYTTLLPDYTRKYYDSICKAQNQLNKDPSKGVQIGEAIASIPGNMVLSILTPKGLEMFGIFFGIQMTPKLIAGAILRVIAKGVGQPVLDFTAELAEEGGSFLASNVLMSKYITDAVEEGSSAAAAAAAIEMITDALDVVGVILFIVQMLTAILDAIDPGGFGEQLDAKSLQEEIVDPMNQQFTEILLQNFSSITDEQGTRVVVIQWPVEYYADRLISKEKGNPPQSLCAGTNQECSYDLIQTKAMAEYLSSLRFNSDGQPLIWKKGGNMLTESDIAKMADHIDYIFADQNVVVALWIKRWWIVILVVVVLLVIFILAIR
jgi:hypothetical protein